MKCLLTCVFPVRLPNSHEQHAYKKREVGAHFHFAQFLSLNVPCLHLNAVSLAVVCKKPPLQCVKV
jgi:hypothetical protein